jgi:prolyl-tRNA editing enzyme YbaK/EbsC (Cys-tRNA(Pro) deacylase)
MSASVDRVRAALTGAGHLDTITTFPAGTRTAADAAAAVGCAVAQIAKSIIFRAGDKPVLVITSGINRVDPAKVSALLAQPVTNVDAEWVRATTGFVIGGVAPIGHLVEPLVLIDEDLLPFDTLWAAAGTPAHVFRTDPQSILRLTSGRASAVKQ